MSLFTSVFVHNLNNIVTTFGFFLAILLGIFLFWRSGRRELVESQTLLDVVAVFFAGALLFGRLADFMVRFDFYRFSIKKLIFFNIFGGFDFHGALIGGILFVWFYLRSKKDKFWFTFDLGASALAFSAFLYLFIKFLTLFIAKSAAMFEYLYYVIGFFIIFWALKRFEIKKKHDGFFTSFFLVSTSLLNLAITLVFFRGMSANIFYFHLIFSSVLACIVSVNWYLLAKRKISKDIKSAFGSTLLLIFKIKRVITNLGEADNTARAIILSPLYLVKWGYILVKYLIREFVSSIFDLVHSVRAQK